jgi:hypothetical protein
MIGAVAGIGGIALAYAVSSGALVSAQVALFGGYYEITTGSGPLVPASSAVGGAVAGALIAAAATALIIQYTGIGKGMSSTEVAALVGLAAAGGAGFGWVPVVGWIFVAVVGAYLLFSWATGVGDTETADIKFTCLPWQPPRGGEKCGECGKNGLPCSTYQCQSLGLTCQFINEGTLQEECINIAPDDATAPIISPDNSVLQTGFSYEVSQNGLGYTVKGPGTDGCLPAFNPVDLGISLSEPGQCKFSDLHTNSYDEMLPIKYFDTLNSNTYSSSHRMSFIVPSLDALATTLESPSGKKDFALYLRCIDKSGNPNVNEYAISFCVNPQPDIMAPEIKGFIPASDSSVALDATEKEIMFVTSEPSECKWSTTDQAYELMPNEVSCDTGTGQQTILGGLLGWGCKVKLPVTADTNTYYFRCKDQPWLTGTEIDGRARNINAISKPYSLKKTITALTITSVSPNGETISSANVPISIDLKVATSGGAEGASTRCEFAMFAGGRFSEFKTTGESEHTQPGLTFFVPKKYELPIKCEDDVGNKAEAIASFELFIDSKGPLITRVYDNGGLNVITNEAATCVINRESCSFDFDKGTLMSGTEFAHTATLSSDATTFVKCKDNFGNLGACMTVKKGVF